MCQCASYSNNKGVETTFFYWRDIIPTLNINSSMLDIDSHDRSQSLIHNAAWVITIYRLKIDDAT